MDKLNLKVGECYLSVGCSKQELIQNCVHNPPVCRLPTVQLPEQFGGDELWITLSVGGNG